MSFLFNAIYLCLLVLASPWLMWRYLRWGKNRRGWLQKLFGLVPRRKSSRPCIWFHAVSVGEVNLLVPVLKRLQEQRPDVEIVISTTTETGFDLANKKYANHCIFFFPLDFTWAIRNALRHIRPSLIVLTELELWPNFIRVASSLNIPVQNDHDFPVDRSRSGQQTDGIPIVIINGRVSDASFRGYRRFNTWLRGSFRRLRLVMAQTESYAERFTSLGCAASRVVVTGNLKFDGVRTDRNNPESSGLARLTGINAGDVVFLAGSTQFEEDLLAAAVYRELSAKHPRLRLILAPRHPERVPQLISTLTDSGSTVQRRSQLNGGLLEGGQHATRPDRNAILVIDVIGELGAWWGVADAAFVGGSMGSRGGQNMIEPAAYGIPVSFGPETSNFKEVVSQLLNAKAATVVHDQAELRQFVERVLTQPDWVSQIGLKAQNVVLQHDGASDHTINHLCALLPPVEPESDQHSNAA